MNLFLIAAPYQLISARELVVRLNLSDNHLRILDSGHFTRTQYDAIIQPEHWQSIKIHNFRYRLTERDFGANRPRNIIERMLELYQTLDQLRKRLLADFIASTQGDVDCLVVGNYRRNYGGYMRHMVNRLTYRNLYVLDVGTDTLRVNEDRHTDQQSGASANNQSTARGFAALKRNFLAWDSRGKESVTFFSAYDLDVAKGDLLLRNDYRYLRSEVSAARATRRVYFVGQPLVDQQYITAETFHQLLEGVRDYFSDAELVYVQHPRESTRQIHIVMALGIACTKFDAPFEYAIAFSGERPMCIATFFSSALENSALIFHNTMRLLAFDLPGVHLLKSHQEVADIYARFREKWQTLGIEVVTGSATECYPI
jgi:hypothetical protein